jgi:hypothetical protein
MAALPFIAAGSLLGGGVQAIGALQAGQAEKDAAFAEATQLEAKGKEEFAASQREALAKKQEGVLANSRVQALAAASGGGADTNTVIKLMSGITSDADYNAATALYGGKERKAGLFDAASNRRRSGRASLLGAKYQAIGSVLGGISGAAGVDFG